MFESHNLFGLSLDRDNNNQPHFKTEEDASWNLLLVPSGINTAANSASHHHGKFTQTVFAASRETVSQSIPDFKDSRNKAYKSTANVWGREKRLAAQNRLEGEGGGGGAEHGGGDGAAGFLSLPAMYIYTRALLEEQELRCAINGVPLGLGPCEPEDKWRQASLDAISPRKGHVQGNLRWICWGFNNTNNDKKKKDIRNMRCAAKEGAPTAWTKELWESYAGIRH